jgi:AraC-like DNA-binding protein
LDKAVFSSDMLPPGLSDRQRFLAWRELHNQYFGRTDLVPSERSFEARMTFAQANEVVLGRGEATLQESEHGGSRSEAIDEGRIGLIINTTAQAFRMRQRGRDELLQAGGTMLVSGVDAVRLSARSGLVSWVMMALPRDAILRAAPRSEDLVCVPLRVGSEALRMIAGYAGLILEEGPVSNPLLDAHVSQTLIDLVGLAAGAEKDGALLAKERGLRAARLEAVAQAIARGYGDPQFSITVVARRLRLSERYVQELLQSTGSGFSERVLELRLRHSVTLLARPDGANRKISDIALASGFSDLSYFHRCFRRRFGVTPAGARTA